MRHPSGHRDGRLVAVCLHPIRLRVCCCPWAPVELCRPHCDWLSSTLMRWSLCCVTHEHSALQHCVALTAELGLRRAMISIRSRSRFLFVQPTFLCCIHSLSYIDHLHRTNLQKQWLDCLVMLLSFCFCRFFHRLRRAVPASWLFAVAPPRPSLYSAPPSRRSRRTETMKVRMTMGRRGGSTGDERGARAALGAVAGRSGTVGRRDAARRFRSRHASEWNNKGGCRR